MGGNTLSTLLAGVGGFLAGGPIGAALAVGSSVYQQQQARKARNRLNSQLNALREESLGQEVRVSGSGQGMEVHYGFTSTSGVQVYADTFSDWTRQTVAGEMTLGGIPDGSGTKNEYLLTQVALGISGVTSLRGAHLSDVPYTNDAFTDTFFTSLLSNTSLTGVANANATVNSMRRDANARFTGLAHATNLFRLNREDPQYSGVPNVRYYMQGRAVYDPRDSNQSATDSSTWTFSNNPALVLLDYLTDTTFGVSIPRDRIDTASFITAANRADVVFRANSPVSGMVHSNLTPDAMGVRRRDIRRYEFNGSISTLNTFVDNIETILNVMPGTIFVYGVDGQFKLSIPDIDTDDIVHIFNEDDLTSTITTVYPDTNSRLNQTTIVFPNASKDFAEDTVTFPAEGSTRHDGYLSEDGNKALVTSRSLFGVSSMYHATYIAAQTIEESRLKVYTWRTRLRGLIYEPGDVVRIQNAHQGIDEVVRITEVDTTADLELEFTAVEYNRNIYRAETIADESIGLPGDFDFTAAPPTNVSVAVQPTDGIDNAIVTWTAANDAAVNEYIIEAALSPSTTFTEVGRVIGQTEFVFFPGSAGTYSFRVTSLNLLGQRSQAVNSTPESVTLGVDTASATRTFYRFHENLITNDPGPPTGPNGTGGGWYDPDNPPDDPNPHWQAITTVTPGDAARRELEFTLSGETGELVQTTAPSTQNIDFRLTGTFGGATPAIPARPETSTFLTSGNAAEIITGIAGRPEITRFTLNGEGAEVSGGVFASGEQTQFTFSGVGATSDTGTPTIFDILVEGTSTTESPASLEIRTSRLELYLGPYTIPPSSNSSELASNLASVINSTDDGLSASVLQTAVTDPPVRLRFSDNLPVVRRVPRDDITNFLGRVPSTEQNIGLRRQADYQTVFGPDATTTGTFNSAYPMQVGGILFAVYPLTVSEATDILPAGSGNRRTEFLRITNVDGNTYTATRLGTTLDVPPITAGSSTDDVINQAGFLQDGSVLMDEDGGLIDTYTDVGIFSAVVNVGSPNITGYIPPVSNTPQLSVEPSTGAVLVRLFRSPAHSEFPRLLTHGGVAGDDFSARVQSASQRGTGGTADGTPTSVSVITGSTVVVPSFNLPSSVTAAQAASIVGSSIDALPNYDIEVNGAELITTRTALGNEDISIIITQGVNASGASGQPNDLAVARVVLRDGSTTALPETGSVSTYRITSGGVQILTGNFGSGDSSSEAAMVLQTAINGHADYSAAVAGNIVTVTSATNTTNDIIVEITAGTNGVQATSTNDLSAQRFVVQNGVADDGFDGTATMFTLSTEGIPFFTGAFTSGADADAMSEELATAITTQSADYSATGDNGILSVATLANTGSQTLTIAITQGVNAQGVLGGNDAAVVRSSFVEGSDGTASGMLAGTPSVISIRIGGTDIGNVQASDLSTANQILMSVAQFLTTDGRYTPTVSGDTLNVVADFMGTTPDIQLNITVGTLEGGGVPTIAIERTVNDAGETILTTNGMLSTYTVTEGGVEVATGNFTANINSEMMATELLTVLNANVSGYSVTRSGSVLTAVTTDFGSGPDLMIMVTPGVETDGTPATAAITRVVTAEGSSGTFNLVGANWQYFVINQEVRVDDDTTAMVGNNLITVRRGLIVDTAELSAIAPSGRIDTNPTTAITTGIRNSSIVAFANVGFYVTTGSNTGTTQQVTAEIDYSTDGGVTWITAGRSYRVNVAGTGSSVGNNTFFMNLAANFTLTAIQSTSYVFRARANAPSPLTNPPSTLATIGNPSLQMITIEELRA